VPKDGDGSLGLGKKKESGFHLSLDRSGGFLTLRYALKERRARLACGTYLAEMSNIRKEDFSRPYLLAYAIFSEYIPLAKNSTSVVTLTNKRPLA